MKKAGIITLFGEYNFGNRLQNYAVQEVLKENGLEVETIKYILTTYKEPIIENEIDKKRLERFKKFNEKINFAQNILYVDLEAPENFSNNYDYIALGSDQIWNYSFTRFFSHKALGSFAPKEKKFSISASFGVNYIPEKDSQLYKDCEKYLKELKAISVREYAGKGIVESLTNREDVQVLIDPTMMIDVKKWENLMKKPDWLNDKKIIIKSFLGEPSKEENDEIEKIKVKYDCQIIDISNKDSLFYGIGPQEFLYLLKNAFLVTTDSFHACVFSILFKTPFVVFERHDNLKSMYSRIETLLEKFNIENRVCKKEITESNIKCNYSKVDEILEEERRKANSFIKKALQ